MSRLRSDLWCGVFVRRHNDLGNMCVVSRRGDPIAGQVFIEIDHLDGTLSLLTPAPGMALVERDADLVFQRRLIRVASEKVRARIERELEFDPDLWVLSLDLRGDDAGIEMLD
ncbi:DUF1491 family protein [Devosia rhodophyticola]|uniref:DUF1491 family protein n=1 Tax=Devosia rhodophyticola TaxID=3026423 RepID=A0ABY7YZB8_9HYPH|nr:DUF1491 family protein [Devosia rhodophyticola]WDR06418.1 DUF1491 family protein [Devosia rhodophyticola]